MNIGAVQNTGYEINKERHTHTCTHTGTCTRMHAHTETYTDAHTTHTHTCTHTEKKRTRGGREGERDFLIYCLI